MADDREERLQEAHNQGQKDGSNGEYNQPNGVWRTDWDIVPQEEKDIRREENEAYKQGHQNATR